MLLHLAGDLTGRKATKWAPEPNPYPFHLPVDRLGNPNGGAPDLPTTVVMGELTVLLDREGR